MGPAIIAGGTHFVRSFSALLSWLAMVGSSEVISKILDYCIYAPEGTVVIPAEVCESFWVRCSSDGSFATQVLAHLLARALLLLNCRATSPSAGGSNRDAKRISKSGAVSSLSATPSSEIVELLTVPGPYDRTAGAGHYSASGDNGSEESQETDVDSYVSAALSHEILVSQTASAADMSFRDQYRPDKARLPSFYYYYCYYNAASPRGGSAPTMDATSRDSVVRSDLAVRLLEEKAGSSSSLKSVLATIYHIALLADINPLDFSLLTVLSHVPPHLDSLPAMGTLLRILSPADASSFSLPVHVLLDIVSNTDAIVGSFFSISIAEDISLPHVGGLHPVALRIRREFQSSTPRAREVLGAMSRFFANDLLSQNRLLSLLHLLESLLSSVGPAFLAELVSCLEELVLPSLRRYCLWPAPYGKAALETTLLLERAVSFPGFLLLRQFVWRSQPCYILSTPHILRGKGALWKEAHQRCRRQAGNADAMVAALFRLELGVEIQRSDLVAVVLRPLLEEFEGNPCLFSDALVQSGCGTAVGSAGSAVDGDAGLLQQEVCWSENISLIEVPEETDLQAQPKLNKTAFRSVFYDCLKNILQQQVSAAAADGNVAGASSSVRDLSLSPSMKRSGSSAAELDELSSQSPVPNMVRIGVAGGDGTLQHFLAAYALLHSEFKNAGIDVRVFVLPFGRRNTVSAWLAQYDGWFRRHLHLRCLGGGVCIPELALTAVQTDPQDVRSMLEGIGQTGHDRPLLCSASIDPCVVLHSNILQYLEEARSALPTYAYRCEGWSYSVDASSKQKKLRDYVILPFLSYAQVGFQAEFLRAQKAAGATPVDVRSFRYSPIEARLIYTVVDASGGTNALKDDVVCPSSTVVSLHVSAVSHFVDRCRLTSHPSVPSLVVTVVGPAAGPAPALPAPSSLLAGAQGAPSQSSAPIVGLGLSVGGVSGCVSGPDGTRVEGIDASHVSRQVRAFKFETPEMATSVSVLLDGELYGPFEKLRFSVLEIPGELEPVSLKVAHFLPVDC